MHRLFVAIRPPRAVRERLLGLMSGIRGARWQSDEQLHLTLRFIGEVDRHQAEDIAAALGGIAHPGFEIALDGVGSFDKGGRPAAIWAGVAPRDALKSLHDKVDSALRRAGVEPDRRAFLPHITLARLNRAAGPIDGFLAANAGLASPPFAVESFRLFESSPGGEGAIYTTIERFGLG